MDTIAISALAANALVILTPYLEIIKTKTVEKIGEELPGAIHKLWDGIQQRMNRKEAAKEALEDILAAPADQTSQIIFKAQLEKILKSDTTFAEELLALVNQAEKKAPQTSVTIQGSHNAVALGNQSAAATSGGIAVHGNVTGNINASDEDRN